jgi:hypothetical protein
LSIQRNKSIEVKIRTRRARVKSGTLLGYSVCIQTPDRIRGKFQPAVRRRGHPFQNRYKFILCEEDPYLLELVRYIHLNPLRAGIVEEPKALDTFPYCGYSVLMGKQNMAFRMSIMY